MHKREWDTGKKWNPFNSQKLLAQVYRWEKIKRNSMIPQPALVTIDPINMCNLDCVWCNSGYIMDKRCRQLSAKTLFELANFLPRWQGSPSWTAGVEAVCIAGGGEPLLNIHTGEFIERLISNNIQVGVVTNGTLIEENMDSLSSCVWVGVSIDAGTPKTYNKLKGLNNSDIYNDVLEGIAGLTEYGKSKNKNIARDFSGYGVSFKFLMHPDNIGEIFEAAKRAKEIGCKNFHLRPAGDTWDRPNDIYFSEDDRRLINEQITRARELEDESFGVYSITHKFDEQLRKCNLFEKCHAIFMTALFMPGKDTDADEDFILGLCCDRRGDSRLEVSPAFKSVQEVEQFWGGKLHWDIFDAIKVGEQCPRCTYQPHNQIYEQVIQRDNMSFRFI